MYISNTFQIYYSFDYHQSNSTTIRERKGHKTYSHLHTHKDVSINKKTINNDRDSTKIKN